MNHTRRVYRIENPTDHIDHLGAPHPRGPYQYGGGDEQVARLATDLCEAHGWDDRDAHPNPAHDGLPISGRLCGFGSYPQMERWFRGWFDRLADAGYVIAVYRVPDEDVQVGRRQATFRVEAAELLWRFCPRLVA